MKPKRTITVTLPVSSHVEVIPNEESGMVAIVLPDGSGIAFTPKNAQRLQRAIDDALREFMQ